MQNEAVQKPDTRVKKRRVRRKLHMGRLLSTLILFIMAIIILLPIILTFLYSFFPMAEMQKYLAQRGSFDATKWMDIKLSPSTVSVGQYYEIMIKEGKYLQYFVNSVKYTVAILLGQALVVPLMAYALSRFTFPFRDGIFFCILMLMVLPFQVTMAPSVIILRALKLMDTPWAIILPLCFSPFYIFLIRQFMVGLPNELLEAGMIDGAGTLRCYVHVVLPVCRPILGAAIALSFADCWNLVEQPLTFLTNNREAYPLSVLFNDINKDETRVAFAGAALYILPALFIYFYFQEDILLGVQLSELK